MFQVAMNYTFIDKHDGHVKLDIEGEGYKASSRGTEPDESEVFITSVRDENGSERRADGIAWIELLSAEAIIKIEQTLWGLVRDEYWHAVNRSNEDTWPDAPAYNQ